MTRIILDVPKDKMQPFLQAIVEIGISRHSISSEPDLASGKSNVSLPQRLRNISKGFILFDWEFYINELEYE